MAGGAAEAVFCYFDRNLIKGIRVNVPYHEWFVCFLILQPHLEHLIEVTVEDFTGP